MASSMTKVLTSRMEVCSSISMLDGWKLQAINSSGDDQYAAKIEINGEFQKLTADIFAHTAFGSSYVEGKEAFKAQRELQQHCISSSADIFIPGSQ